MSGALCPLWKCCLLRSTGPPAPPPHVWGTGLWKYFGEKGTERFNLGREARCLSMLGEGGFQHSPGLGLEPWRTLPLPSPGSRWSLACTRRGAGSVGQPHTLPERRHKLRSTNAFYAMVTLVLVPVLSQPETQGDLSFLLYREESQAQAVTLCSSSKDTSESKGPADRT